MSNTQWVECEVCHSLVPYGSLTSDGSCWFCVKEKIRMEDPEYRKRKAEDDAKFLVDRWNIICPPLYRNTDPSKLDKALLDRVLAWKYGPRGLVLAGDTGTGKSRSAYLLLRKLHFENRIPIRAWDTGQWVNECSRQFKEGMGMEWVENQIASKLLYLDDFGNESSGERGEGELFRLIKRRGEECLPTILTTQKLGAFFRGKFRDKDRAVAVVRRLGEFCDIIEF